MKITVIQKPIETAVTYYRSAMPFGDMARHYPDVNLRHIAAKNFSVDVAAETDILFTHRPLSTDEIRAVFVAREYGCAVWVDIDDLLWQMPPSNPSAMQFTNEHLQVLTECMKAASLVTCSTNYLAERAKSDLGVDALVMRNAWNDRVHHIPEARNKAKSEPLRVLWRGSNTHDGDLYAHRSAFKPRPAVEFQFMGTAPWYFLETYGGSFTSLNVMPWTGNILNYFQELRHYRPHFMVVPLEDNPFNKAKSNIAEIEATVAGAVCISPYWHEEFSGKYPYVASLGDVLDKLHILQADGAWDEQVKFIKSRHALSSLTEGRYQLALNLLP